jgi:methionyl aminopeptidase
MKKDLDIRIKTPEELQTLRDAGKILARIVANIKSSLKIGMTTRDIDLLAEKLIREEGVLPAFKGYHGYPACACVSVNEQVVHGIPGERVIKAGDIVSIDIGIVHQKYFSDMAVSVGLGDLDVRRQKLLDVTRQALYKGIAQAKSGSRLGDLSTRSRLMWSPRDFPLSVILSGTGSAGNS